VGVMGMASSTTQVVAPIFEKTIHCIIHVPIFLEITFSNPTLQASYYMVCLNRLVFPFAAIIE
jgi:hypothetical protein